MKTGPQLAVFLLLMAAAGVLHGGEIIDRIVVTVNGHAVLLSDWDEALRYEALVNGKPLSDPTDAERRAALDRLIDQELLREQMEGLQYPHASAQEVRNQTATIRKQLPGAASDDGWHAMLERYGFTEEEFAARVSAQLDTLRFLDLRLRPNVHVDSGSIESYYREKFLPELRKAGAADVPLAEVSPKIAELLTQQRMDEALSQWLRELRQQSQIHETAGPASSGKGARP